MPYNIYTPSERLEMCKMFYMGQSLRNLRDHFGAKYPERPIPSKETVRLTVQRLEETFNLLDDPPEKIKQPGKHVPEEKQILVCAALEVNNQSSTRTLAREIQLHQELLPGDDGKRMEFCEHMMDRINANPHFLREILFTDECTIQLYGEPNRQNVRVWATDNPHVLRETGSQYPMKVNVWAGIMGSTLIGPFFIDNNLTGERYLHLLQNEVAAALNGLPNNGQIWYQHDGAGPHRYARVRNYLNETFPRRWIGQNGEITWPARSPDLSPMDYYFWGHIKNALYFQQIQTIGKLREKMMNIANSIPPEELEKATQHFYDRLGYCSAAFGEHFEHLL